MTNIEVLRRVASADWNKSYLDSDLKVNGRCVVGSLVKLIVNITGFSCLRSKVNRLCSVDLLASAKKLEEVINATLAENDGTSSFAEKEYAIREANANFEKLKEKAHLKVDPIKIDDIISKHYTPAPLERTKTLPVPPGTFVTADDTTVITVAKPKKPATKRAAQSTRVVKTHARTGASTRTQKRAHETS